MFEFVLLGGSYALLFLRFVLYKKLQQLLEALRLYGLGLELSASHLRWTELDVGGRLAPFLHEKLGVL